jgi:hypothetical protein
MPTSAPITTAGVIAFTLPIGTWGVRVSNESDTLIRRLLGQAAGTSGTSLGLPLAAGAGETIIFKQPLKQAVAYCAIHAGSGDKTLTYEIITQPTQGGTGPSSSTGGSGTSNALLLAGASASTLGALTAATASTGGLFYGTQGGADRKFTLTAAGALLIEAANAAAQRTALGLATAAILGNAQTFTAANVFSVNGATSTPALSLTGSPFTGGTATTTKPLFSIEPTGTTSTGWSTSGTMFGVNAASGFAGNLADLQVNGTSLFKVNSTGAMAATAGMYFGSFTSTTARLLSAGTDFDFIPGTGGNLRFKDSTNAFSMVVFTAGVVQLGSALDVEFGRRAANSFGLGTASASPATQTFGAAQGSGSNITGGTLNIGTRGTGTGTAGRINLQYHAAGSSGSTLGTLVDVLSIVGVGRVRITGIPTSAAGLSTGDIYSNAGILTIV